MATRKQNSVTFESPGTLFSKTTSKWVETWDIPTAVRMAKEVTGRHGAKPYGFYFETFIVSDPVDDGEGGKLQVEPKSVVKSRMHYLGGRVLRFDEIPEAKEFSVLRGNMEANRRPLVVENVSSYITMRPFEPTDCIVNDDGKVTVRGDDKAMAEYRQSKIAEWDAKRLPAGT